MNCGLGGLGTNMTRQDSSGLGARTGRIRPRHDKQRLFYNA